MNPTLVIDCSITMAWCFGDEATAATAAVQRRLEAEAAVAPEHWSLEVANVLMMAERRRRITEPEVREFLALLGTLDIQSDDQSSRRAFEHLVPLCRARRLTSYDAAYLDLALRRQLPLATLDEDLREAASVMGVQLLGK